VASPGRRSGRRYRTRHDERLRATWDAVGTSFWFVPTLMAVGGAALAAISPQMDAWAADSARFAYEIPREDALQLLSTILTSMITMTSLVFSITMVVLTLAANQYGPRLIRNYMADRQTQVILGAFAMTIVFCLLLIVRIGQAERDGATASVSIPVAVGLTLVSVMMLILHIHLLARSMLSETMIERVGRELDAGIAELEPLQGAEDEEEPEAVLPTDFDRNAHVVGVSRQGYVQAIDFAVLVLAAEEADVVLGFRFKPGDYLIAGGRQIGIHPADRATPDLEEKVVQAFTIGSQRTPVQDVGFSIRHLVEIAARALSPGVNDPYTAAAVVDRASASLSTLMTVRLPPGVLRDEAGAVRVVCERPTYESLISVAFDQVRQSGAEKPLVLIHLARAIGRIADAVRTGEQVDLLRNQLRLIGDTVDRGVQSADDRAAVAGPLTSAHDALNDAKRRISGPC
jgi:uncharacterized membrane protein